MNDKMPHTPFSTHLSGSARETERRLKNIFSGPKKRPSLLFLALVFSVCIFCGNLVSCQMAEAEAPEGTSSAVSDPSGSGSVLADETAGLSAAADWQKAELVNFITAERQCEPYEHLTPEEADLLEHLPADELPRQAVKLFNAARQDCWRDLLLPAAADEEHNVTLYLVVSPEEISKAGSFLQDMSGAGIVLRYGDSTGYFPLCCDGNRHYSNNPLFAVDDFDGDGQPEAAVSLLWGWGTGAWSECLYLFDLDTMTCTVPDYTNIPLEITYRPGGTRAEMSSGDKEWPVLLEYLSTPFEGAVAVGNVIRFSVEDGMLLCHLDLDFGCNTLGYLNYAEFPVVCENGGYKLGPAVHMGDIL